MRPKHVEAYDKLIIKQDFVHQIGWLLGLYWDARSPKHKKNWNNGYTNALQRSVYAYIACLFTLCIADIAGGKEAEGVWEHGVEENIWT